MVIEDISFSSRVRLKRKYCGNWWHGVEIGGMVWKLVAMLTPASITNRVVWCVNWWHGVEIGGVVWKLVAL